MRFQRERAHDVMDEILPLLVKHWHEIAHYRDIELEPDWEMYLKMEDSGVLRVFTARDDKDDDRLVGYAVFFIKHNIHYKSSLQALQDILFIDPDHRGGTGLRLIRWTENELRKENVQIILHHLKIATPHTIELFKRIGYEPIDIIVGKRLDVIK